MCKTHGLYVNVCVQPMGFTHTLTYNPWAVSQCMCTTHGMDCTENSLRVVRVALGVSILSDQLDLAVIQFQK